MYCINNVQQCGCELTTFRRYTFCSKPTSVTLCVLYLHCRVQAMAMQEEKLQRKREAGELAREVREQKLDDERAEQVVSLQVCMLHTLYY